LYEANPHHVKFTLKVVGVALLWQNENIETWLTFDDKRSVKLDRTALDISTAALLGGIFKSEYNVTLSGLNEGCHTIEIQVYNLQTCWDGNVSDYYGTSKLDLSKGSVRLKIDTTAPAIGNISIENTIYFVNDLELNCTVDEPFLWITYKLDNQANITIKTNPQQNYTINNTSNETIQVNTNLTNLTEGTHSLTIYAKDTAGNTGVSSTITFTVVKLELVVMIASVLIGVAAVATLIVYRRHRKIRHLMTINNV